MMLEAVPAGSEVRMSIPIGYDTVPVMDNFEFH
jgi:hypothetical protein